MSTTSNPFRRFYWNWREGMVDERYLGGCIRKFRVWLGVKILGRFPTPKEIYYMQKMVDAEHELGMYKEETDKVIWRLKNEGRSRRPDEGELRG